ncbi:hypothetical protein GVO57_06300 [Sphingomonas changnyeongensis]|uniref:HTH luxR-type domain-containing protein n=1 Tax=Sphingomonas changnyeongensis TaxID=2698679 RepID=A0A7Z2S993_9SPHN|nr:LuxR C-terminal-related transcriptional regulator [Sphingomonas changnyeongensis]QHL90524.1 hypothetical protein GVO57_06300 [Sphingomonas changnyeongensis]
MLAYLGYLSDVRRAYLLGLGGQGDASLVVVDQRGQPLFVHDGTRPAADFLSPDNGFSLADPAKQKVFDKVVKIAVRGMRSAPILAETSPGLVSLLHAKPIRDQQVSVLFNLARAIVFVRECRVWSNRVSESLREAFGLTEKESRVAILSGQGKNPREIASEMGISYETVRSHLKSIFAKMGVKRQAEVAFLVARMESD